MIVAINKVDKPDANPTKVRTDLLQHEGRRRRAMCGRVQDVEVSAHTGQGLTNCSKPSRSRRDPRVRPNPDRPAEAR